MQHKGPLFRAHNPYWSWDPVSGEGARMNGGRFNPIGTPAIYMSETVLTTIREASPLGRPMEPLTICEYQVDCGPVFDATNPALLAAHGITFGQLQCPNWMGEMLSGRVPASHTVADQLIANGFAGLRVQSFARGATPRDVNVVFWRWGDTPPEMIRVIDSDGRLPGPPV
ncbi:RES domain protein [Falsiruegeria litorea R37]|uniref:RES domain protein n=1 Tax=Falsiruegeria litorea R37 TaxID=1200284 RepID=A0A1Y5TV03_9RHOB|nr:RES domain-containing protein [Falsiruegeria litorea]SLN73305.1 RES domain protein [Falsiruegeria litorea R37]